MRQWESLFSAAELQRSCPELSYHRVACGPGANYMTCAEQQRKQHLQQISGLAADRLQGAAALEETMLQEIDAEGNPLEEPLREDPAWGDLQPFDLSSGACCSFEFESLAGKCITLVVQAIQLASVTQNFRLLVAGTVSRVLSPPTDRSQSVLAYPHHTSALRPSGGSRP